MQSYQGVTKNPKPGFANRLTRVLNLARQREHGQIKTVAGLTGLSSPGARKLFTEDRPPRSLEAFHSLVSGLSILLLNNADIKVCDRDIEGYLLDDNFVELFSTDTEFRDELEQSHPLVAGAIHLKIHQIGASLGVNVYSDIQDAQLSRTIGRIFNYFESEKPEIDSDEFEGIIRSQILLAKAKID